jgi:GT2 family glycosyltransferase
MTVAVLIVNWNGGPNLETCLESLRQQHRQPDRIIVVDNASSDDSLRRADALLQRATLIRLTTNTGFACANNIAIREAGTVDFLALLNPDAFPEPEWLEALLDCAQREPAIASFASQLRLASDSTRLDGAGDEYHASGRAWRRGHGSRAADWPAQETDVFAPCAAAALYRREAVATAGGFDERYFCYFEDVDLGFRLQLMGHRCRYVPAARVRHVSSAVGGYRSDFAVYHGERNMVWTFIKNMPAPLFWWCLPQHVILNLVALAYYPFRRQGLVAIRAKFDAICGLRRVWRDRRIVQCKRTVDALTVRRAFTPGVLIPYLRLGRGRNVQ